MNKTGVLIDVHYTKLLTDLRKIIEGGKVRATQAAHQELVLTYWEVGRRITQERLTKRAGYGDAVMQDLADELGLDIRTLQQSVLFFQQYKTCPRARHLTWSHYRILLGIHNRKERQWYERLVIKEGLIRDHLMKAIKDGRYEERGEDPSKEARELTRPKEATYVYKAFVDRVIDGDTLYLRMDLGFLVFKEQRIRLEGVDTPPIDVPEGRKAYEYVRDQLARAPFVMVRTNKIDIYGRYVGHVFYSFTEENKDKIFKEGRHLNQELLDKGLAKLM